LLLILLISVYCTSRLGENDIVITCYMSDWFTCHWTQNKC